jgi:flavin reductase (DIM6/NTAB) family NADH-FMN oxidoreductase RutF
MDAGATGDAAGAAGGIHSGGVAGGVHSGGAAAAGAAGSGTWVEAWDGARAAWAGAVTLVMVADGRDDVGATISAFCPLSAEPPLVMVSLMSGSYLAELFSRPDEPVTRFAVTVLAAGQRVLAGRFAAAGRPSARLMLDDVPHRRGDDSGALIAEGGLAALECSAERLVTAGDHLLVIAGVTGVPYVATTGEPLIRFHGRYLPARL